MKTSRRYILATIAAVLAVPAVAVLQSRIAGSGTTPPAPDRTPASQLALLRDFDRIDARGDFTLEVVAGPTYGIVYEPLGSDRGDFRAEVRGGALVLRGDRNRTENRFASVRVSMPALRVIEASEIPSLTVRDFASEQLELRAFGVPAVTLASNRIGTLRGELRGTEGLDLARNRIATSDLRVAGVIRFTIEE